MMIQLLTLGRKSQPRLVVQGSPSIKTGFPDRSVGKNPPAVQETPAPFLGREDSLEKGQATRSSILA